MPFDDCVGPEVILEDGESFLKGYLNSERLNATTGDDKSMRIAGFLPQLKVAP